MAVRPEILGIGETARLAAANREARRARQERNINTGIQTALALQAQQQQQSQFEAQQELTQQAQQLQQQQLGLQERGVALQERQAREQRAIQIGEAVLNLDPDQAQQGIAQAVPALIQENPELQGVLRPDMTQEEFANVAARFGVTAPKFEAQSDEGKLLQDEMELLARGRIGDAAALHRRVATKRLNKTALEAAKLEKTLQESNFAKNKEEDRVAADFTKQSQGFVDLRENAKKVVTSAARKTGAGDIALLFAFMKAQDPRSVVKQDEFATAKNAGGVPARWRNMWNEVLQGALVPQDVRDELVALTKDIYDKSAQEHTRRENIFRGITDRRGLNAKNVLRIDTTSPFEGAEIPRRTEAGPAQPAIDFAPQNNQERRAIQRARAAGATDEQIQQQLRRKRGL